jgi:hypothetical protein
MHYTSLVVITRYTRQKREGEELLFITILITWAIHVHEQFGNAHFLAVS